MFRALLASDNVSPDDYDEGEEEDPQLYLSGEERIERYCVVTINWSSRSCATYFYLPTYRTMSSAKERAEYFDRDDMFEEVPDRIVDLDTGRVIRAEPSYRWHEGSYLKLETVQSVGPGKESA